MVRKNPPLVIELNTSESLAFSGFFGLIFASPNFYQIFLKEVFPTIIETATNNVILFKILYVILLLLITYETYYWIIKLGKIIKKTKNLNMDFNYYMLKVVFFSILGSAVGITLNYWLF